MFDYSERIESFRVNRVRLPSEFEQKLLAHRKANRDRLINRLPEEIEGVTIGESSFRPQGSFAMQTVIQTRFTDEEYDIDDGVVLWKHQLLNREGAELTAMAVKEKVRDALKDDRFTRQPRLCTNCVRVFYADEDEEKHHVDFPVYRKWEEENGDIVRELASEDKWVKSDPTEVNVWFDQTVRDRNKAVAGWGTQFRQQIQLLKRFCRSRPDTEWDMPNGMKLTMLVAECQPAYQQRIDASFRELLSKLYYRLVFSKVIRNLAHPDKPPITKTDSDNNVVELQNRCKEALDKLKELDKAENDNVDAARGAWDWIFRSDGFFKEFDDRVKREEKENALMEKVALIGNGARTSTAGVIGTFGVVNIGHNFYGDSSNDQTR
jgi:hypothetical protein